jgi:hypothetical protein
MGKKTKERKEKDTRKRVTLKKRIKFVIFMSSFQTILSFEE